MLSIILVYNTLPSNTTVSLDNTSAAASSGNTSSIDNITAGMQERTNATTIMADAKANATAIMANATAIVADAKANATAIVADAKAAAQDESNFS